MDLSMEETYDSVVPAYHMNKSIGILSFLTAQRMPDEDIKHDGENYDLIRAGIGGRNEYERSKSI